MTDAAGPVVLRDDSRCARCGGGFHCGIADAGPCACTTLRLDDAALADLRDRYVGCLCLPCLRELGARPVPAAPPA